MRGKGERGGGENEQACRGGNGKFKDGGEDIDRCYLVGMHSHAEELGKRRGEVIGYRSAQ